jgi:hypothetical protein
MDLKIYTLAKKTPIVNRQLTKSIEFSSVADPDPDPLVFWPPGSGSTSQRYGSGSGSFYHHAKIVSQFRGLLVSRK